MGKKSRNKRQASRHFARKKRVTPDDYFRRGPFETARFGKQVVYRNNMNAREHQVFMRHLAGELPAVIRKVDAHVAAIVGIVESHDPLSILQRGFWMSIWPHIMPSDQPEEPSGVVGQRMVDYVQSVIAAVPPKITPAPLISEEAWTSLSSHVEELFTTINHAYIGARTADWTINGSGPPEDQIEFYVRALLMWCNVTGHRYHCQEIDHLRDLIAPHSDVFQRLWNVEAEGILRGLSDIADSLTRGLGIAFEKIDQASAAYERAKDEAVDNAEALDTTIQALRNEDIQIAFDRIYGFGLFVIDRYLPRPLLEDLSWAPGECRDFIDGQAQSGWPTRIWPRSRRPFLKIGESYYCFDMHTLFDHIYRVLERTVRDKEPIYRQRWNDRQKEVSEQLPFTLFAKLLPGARTWRGVCYEIDEVDIHGRRKWCEVDGLLVYEDHLFILEVKGGTFTAASPETGLDGHLKSIERLIFAPVDQGARFRHWLERQAVVSLYDEDHKTIGELKRNDFAHVTICAISLDAFTELSAKAYHLALLAGRTNAEVFWALSVSDLRTYSELFDNPLVFLHYVEKRNQATASGKIVLDDELDHYGLYLEYNHYETYAERVAGEARINWIGFRGAIDKYFDDRTRGEPATPPRQNIPPLYSKIIEWLGTSRCARRRAVASLLLDCAGDMRSRIENTLVDSLRIQREKRRLRPVTIGGQGVRITFVLWEPGFLEPGSFDAAEHCKTAMLAAQEPDRWSVELFFDAHQILQRVEPNFFRTQDISPDELTRLELLSKHLIAQRFDLSSTAEKTGRNQLCPCGSGKKYKRCCGA